MSTVEAPEADVGSAPAEGKITPEAIKELSVDGLSERVRASILELLGWSETLADPAR